MTAPNCQVGGHWRTLRDSVTHNLAADERARARNPVPQPLGLGMLGKARHTPKDEVMAYTFDSNILETRNRKRGAPWWRGAVARMAALLGRLRRAQGLVWRVA
jgi:hypothetical protein